MYLRFSSNLRNYVRFYRWSLGLWWVPTRVTVFSWGQLEFVPRRSILFWFSSLCLCHGFKGFLHVKMIPLTQENTVVDFSVLVVRIFELGTVIPHVNVFFCLWHSLSFVFNHNLEPSLLGAPRRDGFTFCDGGRPLRMRPGVDIRNPSFCQPPLCSHLRLLCILRVVGW